jgi:hypothetical protein
MHGNVLRSYELALMKRLWIVDNPRSRVFFASSECWQTSSFDPLLMSLPTANQLMGSGGLVEFPVRK